jgi:crotonobetainyl-CoA:carnitine CoA-transferase CaiB-like acyl-CoA transferase
MLSAKPLRGLKILEIGHSIAAPYTGMILAELGADVIKLENPDGGDYARDWGPPFWGGAASAFQTVNRGKRGVAVDLTKPEDAARVRELIRTEIDVVVHNLKFGAMERLDLGPETLVKAKPSLIVCNMGAFGSVGPLRDRPGYDPLMQAFGGLMSILGEDGRPPVRVTVSIMDMATGMWAAIGILAAVAEQRRTGAGGVVDCSLFETALAWMTVPIAAYLSSGELQGRTGSANAQIVPYQAFATADGFVMVAAGNDRLFRLLCEVLNLPALPDDARFRTNADRVVNRVALIALLSPVFVTATTKAWIERLDRAGVPAGPIHTVDEVVAHPQTKALGMLQNSPDGELSLLGLPLQFDGERPAFERRAPRLGEHTAEVLGKDLGEIMGKVQP